jgi:hypothetical protein
MDSMLQTSDLIFSLNYVFLGVTWVLVYRTEKYKRLKTEIDKQSKKRKLSFLTYRLLFDFKLTCLVTLQLKR